MSRLHSFCNEIDHLPPSGIREFFDMLLEKKEIISLGVGEPDFATPSHIAQAGLRSIKEEQTAYTSNKGLTSLREAISGYLKPLNNVTYDPETEILITNGASEGIDIILRALLNPEDSVIVPEPSYVCYSPLVQLCKAHVAKLDTSKSNFIPDPVEIERLITPKTKAIILCSPNNPTGVTIPTDILKQIAAIAKKHGIWIISDEIYIELQYENNTKSISCYDVSDQTIVVSGFSKAFAMTGWRLGYIAGPESIISRALKIHQYSALCAPTMAQYAALAALQNPKETITPMKNAYNERRQLLIETFKNCNCPMPTPTGAFYCFPDISITNMDGMTFAKKLLEEENVAVVPGSGFGVGGDTHIRCCYAYPLDTVTEACKRLSRFIKKYSGG